MAKNSSFERRPDGSLDRWNPRLGRWEQVEAARPPPSITAAEGVHEGGGYKAADPVRRAQRNWFIRTTSADSATLPQLRLARGQSRDLVRNNPLAAGIIGSTTTSVVGTGLSVQPQIHAKRLGMSPEAAAEWQRDWKERFDLWADDARWCDVASRLNFYEMQELAFRSALESGDVGALLPMQRFRDEPFATKVQLVEADRICNENYAADDEVWAAGVRVTEYGRPVEYAIAAKHPGSYLAGNNTWSKVKAFGEKTGRRNFLHLVTVLRPDQRRGMPWLTPVIEPIRQIGTYTDAEIMAAVVAGAFTVFVKSEATGNAAIQPSASPPEIHLDSGAIVDLAPGEDIVVADPKRPNSAFDPFITAVLRQIGVGLELPYEVLIKHFTASYSAARAALLEAWRFYRKRRQWLASRFCQPIYEELLAEAVALGHVRAPGFFADPVIRAAYCRAVWIGDAPGAIDPLKEAEAAEKRIDIGISTRAKESIAYDGSSWEDNNAQLERERQARDASGLGVQTSVRPPILKSDDKKDPNDPDNTPNTPVPPNGPPLGM